MTLNFHVTGKGFPVVLLHGFCENKDVWSGFAQKLSRHFQVLVPDLPGFGESELPTSQEISINYIAEQVYFWMKSLEIHKAAVIGHSMGGYITLALAKNHPEVISGIGLLNSTAFPDNEQKKLTRNKTINFIQSHGIKTFIESFIPPLFYQNNHPNLSAQIKWMVNLASKTPEETAIKYTQAMRDRESGIDLLKTLEAPILILSGEYDNIIPVEDIYEQELLPKKGIVHIMSNTGHMSMLEDEDNSLQVVEDFLQVCLA